MTAPKPTGAQAPKYLAHSYHRRPREYGHISATIYVEREFCGNDVEMEVEVSGLIVPPEPDVGYLSEGIEDIEATRGDSGAEFLLDKRERARAEEALWDAHRGRQKGDDR